MQTAVLFLTQGSHIIDDDAARKVEAALREGLPSVDVEISITGATEKSRACFSMSHVIGVIRRPAATEESLFNDEDRSPNVYALRRR